MIGYLCVDNDFSRTVERDVQGTCTAVGMNVQPYLLGSRKSHGQSAMSGQ